MWPTAATCGSVKITRGESGPSAPCGEHAVVAEDVVGREARLVLAHVGEQRAAVDVADRVEPVVAGDAHVLVDLDRLAGLEADGLEPEVVGRGRAAERDEQPLGLDALPPSSVVHGHVPSALLDLRAFWPVRIVDAVALAAPR